MTSSETYKEIVSITTKLIETGLTIDEKYPVISNHEITWTDQSDISVALKNVPYIEKYDELNKERNYNFKMLDGALVQIMYVFDRRGKEILSHRLAFYPSPILERFDENPEGYDKFFGDSEFHDIVEFNVINCPVRFDFNSNSKYFIDVDHPYAHVHFGEIENCRIPLGSPLTPSAFINFILRNFYNYAIRVKGEIIKKNSFVHPTTITSNETKIVHFNLLK